LRPGDPARAPVGEKRYDEALANARKCCELEPNYINSIYIPGHVLTYVGKEEAEEAIGLIKEVCGPAPFPCLTIQ
jgi:HEPN domain-containing protein